MRKFFTLISAALLSLTSLHATVVTQDFTLSSCEAYQTATVSNGVITGAAAWAGTQLWEWKEGASVYDQVVLTLEDHAEKVLFQVIYSDDSEVQTELPVGVNSAVIDITQDIIKGVKVINWSESNDVSITISNICLRGAIGNRKNVTIWSGTKTFEEFNWNDRLQMSADKFEDLHVGDILEVYYTTDAQTYHQIDVKTEYDHNYPAFASAQITLGGSSESGVLRFYIAESSDLSNIASQGGLYLNGKYITFTKVSVIKHEVLWTGTQVVGEWSGGQSIDWSKLSDLKKGNILCVRVTSAEYAEGEYNQVFCSYKGDWSGTFSPSVNYLFQESDVMPMIVEIPVTYKMINQFKGEQLNIGGKNYTMTDIYVLEGTPAANVAAFLNVTSAKMATYVLPFGVPELPDGVKAYRLTNNGSNEIVATELNAMTADQPVLIVADEGEYEFRSADGASDDISSKTGTYTDGALVGTYQTIAAVEATTATNYNYVLQNGTDGVAFYQVKDATCSIAPYHAYLSCGYNAMAGGSSAPMRIRYVEKTATGIDGVEQPCMDAQKRIENGQLFIIRDGKTYNALGLMVK